MKKARIVTAFSWGMAVSITYSFCFILPQVVSDFGKIHDYYTWVYSLATLLVLFLLLFSCTLICIYFLTNKEALLSEKLEMRKLFVGMIIVYIGVALYIFLWATINGIPDMLNQHCFQISLLL